MPPNTASSTKIWLRRNLSQTAAGSQHSQKYSNEKSPEGKVDYHTMGACYEVMALIRAGGKP
jgi:mannose/cellobiose epimerase-like protein (N-acyl-D-glucosamine 2-epimerase family)